MEDATNNDAAPSATDDRADASDRRFRNRAIAVGIAAGLTLAGLGVASAQTEDAPAGEADDAAAVVPAPAFGLRAGGPGMMRHGIVHGPGMGIHGEFTTRGPDDGWQTIATQVGEVTEVSAASLTVKSEDGFTRTYTVNDDTLVNAGNDGIADVKTGDDVRVMAVVKDGKATAVDVNDGTRIQQSREKWAPTPKRADKPADSDA